MSKLSVLIKCAVNLSQGKFHLTRKHEKDKVTPSFRSYLPLMYIAIQYMEQNELNSAHQYFKLSLEKNNSDPYLYNEFAVYYYKTKNYVLAKQTLHEALKKAKKFHVSRSIIWEKLWCNLGHVYRHQPCVFVYYF